MDITRLKRNSVGVLSSGNGSTYPLGEIKGEEPCDRSVDPQASADVHHDELAVSFDEYSLVGGNGDAFFDVHPHLLESS